MWIHLFFQLSDTATRGQIGPGSNGIERVLHILQNTRTGTSPSVKYDRVKVWNVFWAQFFRLLFNEQETWN